MTTSHGSGASDVTVLCCPSCLRPLSTTTHRVPYCMSCGKSPEGAVPGRPASAESPPFENPGPPPTPTHKGREAKMVLCCAECENELSLTPGGGSYCTHCRYSPSMQDTFFKGMCPGCNVETRKPRGQDRTCPECGETFTN